MSNSSPFSKPSLFTPTQRVENDQVEHGDSSHNQVSNGGLDSPPLPSPSSSSPSSPFAPDAEHSVSTPPPPPPMPNTDMSIRFQIYKLEEQIEILEEILKGDSTIGITGVNFLRQSENGPPTWEDRLHTFLFDVGIHFAWYFNFVPNEPITLNQDGSEQDPDTVFIYFINDVTKTQAIHNITMFLKNHYDNYVYLL